MGNASSAFQRISSIIPPCHEPVWEDSPKWADKLRDRDQLIHAIIFIFSNNGKDSLDGYDFRLLYRKEEDAAGESFAATMIAVREGTIKSQIESRCKYIGAEGMAGSPLTIYSRRRHTDKGFQGFQKAYTDSARRAAEDSA